MSKKKEEITDEEEVKEKTEATSADTSNVETDPKVEVESKEESTDDTKNEIIEDATENIKSEVEETTVFSDPFDDWSSVFEEFHKDIPSESEIETPQWLNCEEIRMVAREEIKGWVKGVQDGSYPMPTGVIQHVDTVPEQVANPFPEKEFKSVQDEIVEIKKSKEKVATRLDEIAKSLETMKKEIGVIRDMPIEVVEKSMTEDIEFEPKIRINPRDRSITRI